MCARTTGFVSHHRHRYTEVDTELKTFAKHLRKTHMYKQQAKHYLILRLPVLVLRYCELEIPVTINVTCLMNAINNNILSGVRCYSF